MAPFPPASAFGNGGGNLPATGFPTARPLHAFNGSRPVKPPRPNAKSSIPESRTLPALWLALVLACRPFLAARGETEVALKYENYAERGDRTNGLANASEGLRGNVQSVMRVLADATGGVMAIESNDPRRQLRELISDTQTYYEVSYDPKIADYNGAFRKTSFKVKQGDYRVRDRDGYLAMPPGQENLLPYELPLLTRRRWRLGI